MTYGRKIVEDEEEEPKLLPSPKRPRYSYEVNANNKTDAVPPALSFCQHLLSTSEEYPIPGLPPSLLQVIQGRKIQNDVGKLKQLLDGHGFRTSFVSSPRKALSVYKDSCEVVPANSFTPSDGKMWLVTLLGLHPNQDTLERFYSSSIKEVYCLMIFCQRIRKACPVAVQDESIADLVSGCELQCRSLGRMMKTDSNFYFTTSQQIIKHAHTLSASVPRLVATLIQRVVHAEPRNRVEQLEREWERISLWNSTLSNAMVTLFCQQHQCHVKDMFYKRSPHQPQYERITIYLFDPQVDHHKPPHFLFLPSLRTILRRGPDVVVEEMMLSFWSHLLRHGYFATQAMKDRLSVNLKEFFSSGITQGPNTPLQLNAHFTPTRPLSFYLYGKAGAGKSSFVRNFQPALEATIEESADPEILARFVKQNLNKRLGVLELELELRPNNNDLSVMSIIQGRRMTMTQSKPGLVVVDLEEMPSNDEDANPNQLKVAQLISQRFSGRNGEFQGRDKPAPRNSDKRGIANDASLVTLFTSNYELDSASEEALKRLKMFETLDTVEMTAVSGSDRVQLANSYLRQCIKDRFVQLDLKYEISLDITVGEGDTRPLVRYLRMIAFYICALVSRSIRFGSTIEAKIQQKGPHCMIFAGGESMELKTGTLDNLFPVIPRVCDARVADAVKELGSVFPNIDELSIILDFWFAKTLAPAVIVSNDRSKIRKLIEAVRTLKNAFCIEDVNADVYKMMKSLYDPNDTPNLRDDILKFGRGANIAVEIECPSKDAQLCIREMIEDSPSMTAFSTAKSALYKEGLLFAVHVNGEITPEVQSRASIIL